MFPLPKSSLIDAPQLLREAAKEGNLEVVQYLVSKGVSMIVLDQPKIEMAERLNPGKRFFFYFNALRFAIEGGHLDVMTYLYDQGCRCDAMAIMDASRLGRLEFLQYIDKQGYDWNAMSPKRFVISSGIRHEHPECSRFLIERNWKDPDVAINLGLKGWQNKAVLQNLLDDPYWKKLFTNMPLDQFHESMRPLIACDHPHKQRKVQ